MSTISKLQIDQQLASIGVKTTPAQVQITTPHPTMEIVQELPQMTIERVEPTFKMNWQKVHAESGLKPPITLTKSQRDEARSKTMRAINEAVTDGDFLGKVEQPGNRVAQLYRRKSMKTADKEINIGSMPQSRPEVEWERGSVQISWSDHKFDVVWDGEYMPEILVDPPYSVEIFLRNQPHIKITLVNESTPDAGKRVDKKL